MITKVYENLTNIAFQPMDSTKELLQAMELMVCSQNWQGYLYFRRNYVAHGGKQRAIVEMLKSLPFQAQLVYAKYFNTTREVSKPVRVTVRKEAAKNNKIINSYLLSKIQAQ